jgi:hypothetical protein
MLPQLQHSLAQRARVRRGHHQAGLTAYIYEGGSGTNLAGDHWLAVHRPLQQRYAEGLGAQVRGKDHAVAGVQECGLVGLGYVAEEVHVRQAKLCGLGLELGLGGTGAHNDDRKFGALRGLQQDVQALVVAQHANEQEEPGAKALPPIVAAAHVRGWVGSTIHPDRDHGGLVPQRCQNLASLQIVGRGGHDMRNVIKKSIH